MNSESVFFHSEISHLKNKLDYESTILHGERNAIINSDKQPPNGSIFLVAYGTETVTLPLSEIFKNIGSKIIIISNASSNIKILPASQFSNDVLIYNCNTYSKGTDSDYQFTDMSSNYSIFLSNRGIIELIWTTGGWYVLNQYGLNIAIQE